MRTYYGLGSIWQFGSESKSQKIPALLKLTFKWGKVDKIFVNYGNGIVAIGKIKLEFG